MRKSSKNKIANSWQNLIVGIFYAFRQATKVFFRSNTVFAANLDPFYLFGLLYVPTFIRRIKRQWFYVAPIIFYAILQMIILQDLDVIKLIINVAKIIVCIFVLFYVKDNWKKISVYKVVRIATILLTVTTLIALIFTKTNLFWRVSDVVNKYNLVRLHGMFLEPSELGFHAMILVIALLCYFVYARTRKRKIEIGLLIAGNILTLYLARPFGAIVVGIVAIMIMAIVMLIRNVNKKNMAYALVFIFGIVIVALVAWRMGSPIVSRLVDTFSGTDMSNNYRVDVSWSVLGESIVDSSGVGIGFGNMNTENFATSYKDLGVVGVVANSFQYFIIEGGIFAIIFLIILWYKLIMGLKSNFTYLKLGILVFLFLYQIFGGHFTSGLTWALYGLAISGFNESEDLRVLEEKKE